MSFRAHRATPQVCPACERFIAAAPVCPYCGCDAAVPPAVRLLRAGAVSLATAGLALLYLAARTRGLPEASAGTLSPRMNQAAVRMSGLVVSQPHVGRERGAVDYLSFRIHDGSGAVRVQAFDRVARDLVARAPLPAKGQRVAVTGNLSVPADGETKLRLRAVRDLEVMAGQPGAGQARETGGDG